MKEKANDEIMGGLRGRVNIAAAALLTTPSGTVLACF
jgi:hypothetical protein